MTRYAVTVFVNVDPEHHFMELQAGQQVAEVDTFTIEAAEPGWAAEKMFAVGNKEVGPDADGKDYPRDVRSVSVGDLVKVVDPDGRHSFWACESMGFNEIPEPANPIVALEGTWATSRGRR